MNALLGHSVTYRIAVGPHAGRKVFSLQTLPSSDEPGTDKVAGFSLHAGVAARANERDKLERLCRYITRPALSEKCLSLTENGQVRYELKTPYRDGTTHVFFEPLDFMAKLAALVPKPRVNLTRFHGVFAPNSKHRVQVTPAKRGKGGKPPCTDNTADQTAPERHVAMTWAQRLKRVFGSDIETWQQKRTGYRKAVRRHRSACSVLAKAGFHKGIYGVLSMNGGRVGCGSACRKECNRHATRRPDQWSRGYFGVKSY